MATKIFIDPPSGWKYGFPKEAPSNIREMENANEWLVQNGYPQDEVDIWMNSEKFGYVPYRMFEMEVKENEKSLYERFHGMFNDMIDRDELSDEDYRTMNEVEQLLKRKN
jgi:hypothetical protein